MESITPEQLKQALTGIGFQRGDGLLIHSAIQFLGEPEGGAGMYYDVLMKIIGNEGTLVVPTFNFNFAKSGQYDPATTRSVGMGTFSEYIRMLPEAKRTTHPMQSLAVIGNHASDLAGRDTPCAFDDDSAFDRMLQLDFKLLLLGASIQAASVIHYSEQRAKVPYRYWKDFSGMINTSQGPINKTYRMFVRDMGLNPKLAIADLQKELAKRSQWHAVKVNYGEIASCSLRDFVQAANEMLRSDPWVFVTNKPKAGRA